jgi:hypothetical protein
MIQAVTVLVGSTATRLVGGSGAPVAGAGGQKVLVKNTHATDKLIIGGSGVTAANGFGIDAGVTFDLGNLEPNDVVYAVRGGSADISAQVFVK